MAPFFVSHAVEPQGSLKTGIQQLEAGAYRQAEKSLQQSLFEFPVNEENQLSNAIVLRWLAQAVAAQGRARHQEALQFLEQALGLIDGLDSHGVAPGKLAGEVARTELVRAQLLRLEAVRRLHELRLTGEERNAFFEFLRLYIEPAVHSLTVAAKNYPKDRMADVLLAKAELVELSLNLNRLYFPARDFSKLYTDLREKYQQVVAKEEERGSDSRADVVASAWIGIGTAFRDEAALSANDGHAESTLDAAEFAFTSAILSGTGHVELKLTAAIGKAHSLLDRYADCELPTDKMRRTESLLLEAAEGYEQMRLLQAQESAVYETGSFFSTRTTAYEALLLLYEKSGQPEKMLHAVEQMKARDFQALLFDDAADREAAWNLSHISMRLKAQNAGLVEYFYGPGHAWFFWILPGGKVEVSRLPLTGQELTRKADAVLKGFSKPMAVRLHLRRLRRRGEANPVVTKAFEAANELYEILLKPVELRMREAGADLLYIVPHHMLHYLPFHALVTVIDKKDLCRSTFFIQKNIPIAYLPAIAAFPGEPLNAPSARALVFARTDFTQQEPRYASDLPNAIIEARMAASVLGVDPFLEVHATETRFRSFSGPFSILYFATHGDLNSVQPLDSSLLLAEDSQNNGYLTVRELLTGLEHPLGAELVVLSACHTNRGEPNPLSGDDIASLSRGFLAAGARSVLATQWEASDDLFPVFMAEFLSLLTASESTRVGKAAALNRALQRLVTEAEGIERHPLFWAPAVILGDGWSAIGPAPQKKVEKSNPHDINSVINRHLE